MTGRPTLVFLAALWSAWKVFYHVQTGAEPWRIVAFGVAAVLFGGVALVGAAKVRRESPKRL